MNHLWRSVAPFPSPVTTADVYPVTTAVMELMTVMITVMSICVAHLVSSLHAGDASWDEQREVGGKKKKKETWVISVGKKVSFKISVFKHVLQMLLGS